MQLVLWIVDSGFSKHMTGLGHNLYSVGQFCDGDLEVAFRSRTCYVWKLEGNDLLTGSRDSNLYTISISELVASSPMFLRNRTLVKATRTMLIFSNTLEFIWTEAIATACFTQNRSIVHTRKMKPKADIGIFIGYSESSREYYATSTPEVSDNSAANTLNNDDTPSSSLIVAEEDEAL
nr:putative ribonuclease H-like domain-containing protein [Tanacetum cinerariifolium]